MRQKGKQVEFYFLNLFFSCVNAIVGGWREGYQLSVSLWLTYTYLLLTGGEENTSVSI
jgi:hypothetical protein